MGSILLPTKNTPAEIRKMGLDISEKLDAITPDGAKYITTGNSLYVENLPPKKQYKDRVISFVKKDSGTGEVQLKCAGTDLINGKWTSLYLHDQFQHIILLGVDSGYMVYSGRLQPTAAEPDIGGGWHSKYVTLVNAYDPTVATDIVVTANVPDLTRLINIYFLSLSATTAARILYIKDYATNVVDLAINPTTGIYGVGHCSVPLNADKQFKIQASNADVSSVYVYQLMYCLGPV